MVHAHTAVVLLLLILLPARARGFFTRPVTDIIEPTGQLRCLHNDAAIADDHFQLCAIRVYTPPTSSEDAQEVIVQNGMWFTNIFRRLIVTRRCTGFDDDTTDIGLGTCNIMPYETAQRMTLCICATDNCNENLETCESANRMTTEAVKLPTSLPVLTTTIGCNQTSDRAAVCDEHVLIHQTECEFYVRSHYVLCTIGTSGEFAIHDAQIEEKYEALLDGKLRALKPVIQANPSNPLRDENTYIYYMYRSSETTTTQECACTQSAFCNLNIAACAPFDNSSVATNTSITDAPQTSPTTLTTTANGSSANNTETIATTSTVAATNGSLTNPFETVGTTATSMPIETPPATTTNANPSAQAQAPGFNTNIIIGVVVAILVVAIFVVVLICCQCLRSDRCARSPRDQSRP